MGLLALQVSDLERHKRTSKGSWQQCCKAAGYAGSSMLGVACKGNCNQTGRMDTAGSVWDKELGSVEDAVLAR